MTENLGSRIALLAGAEVLWCALHSAMIATPWVEYLKRRLGTSFRYYRLAYNAIALATFLPLVAVERRLYTAPFFAWDGGWAAARYAVLAAVVVLGVAGARQYDLPEFLGLRQLGRRQPTSGGVALGDLNTAGILGLTRHPWYLAALLLFWVRRDLDLVTLVSNSVFSVYLVVGTILEERKLVAEFGDRYRRYQTRVSMLLPLKWRRGRFG